MVALSSITRHGRHTSYRVCIASCLPCFNKRNNVIEGILLNAEYALGFSSDIYVSNSLEEKRTPLDVASSLHSLADSIMLLSAFPSGIQDCYSKIR